MFIAFFTVAKVLWEQPKCPLVDEGIKKMWYSIYNGTLFSLKIERSPVTYDNKDEFSSNCAKLKNQKNTNTAWWYLKKKVKLVKRVEKWLLGAGVK